MTRPRSPFLQSPDAAATIMHQQAQLNPKAHQLPSQLSSIFNLNTSTSTIQPQQSNLNNPTSTIQPQQLDNWQPKILAPHALTQALMKKMMNQTNPSYPPPPTADDPTAGGGGDPTGAAADNALDRIGRTPNKTARDSGGRECNGGGEPSGVSISILHTLLPAVESVTNPIRSDWSSESALSKRHGSRWIHPEGEIWD